MSEIIRIGHISDLHLGLQHPLGMNTVARYSRMGNPIGSNGEVDDEQFETLKKMFARKDVRKKARIISSPEMF